MDRLHIQGLPELCVQLLNNTRCLKLGSIATWWYKVWDAVQLWLQAKSHKTIYRKLSEHSDDVTVSRVIDIVLLWWPQASNVRLSFKQVGCNYPFVSLAWYPWQPLCERIVGKVMLQTPTKFGDKWLANDMQVWRTSWKRHSVKLRLVSALMCYFRDETSVPMCGRSYRNGSPLIPDVMSIISGCHVPDSFLPISS